MHDALLIPEVLGSILNHLAEDTIQNPGSLHATTADTRGGRRALAVLARTCRAFSEPALDAVWRRLYSLEPLVLCTRTSFEGRTVTLPPFNEDEWNTVSRYSPRVQELTLEYDSLSMKVLQSLWFRTALLLPNLQKLYWRYEDYTQFGPIRLLLSPSLVCLHAWLDNDEPSSVLGFLECLHTLCPNITSLYFDQRGCNSHVRPAVSCAIRRFPNLETLRCVPIEEAALIYIAGSHHLRRFSADMLDYEPDYLRRIAGCGYLDHPPFANLRALELSVHDLSSIIPYLKAHQQPFEEVSFEFRMLPTPGMFHEFFTALESTTRLVTLRHIKLLSIDPDGPITNPVDFRDLIPLMSFNLHKLDVNLGNPVSLNDDELAHLVQAWPELETFYFYQCYGWDYLQSFQIPSLRGLLFILARCPKLRYLGTIVDARNIPSLTEDESLICNTAIKKLVLASSPIQEPVSKVTHFLLDHFPSLIGRPAVSVKSLHSPYQRMWREVNMRIEEINGRDPSLESSDSETESGFDW